ncbi:MAG: PAS domain-containing protein [Candidatus Methanoculleus thermohydrogenotrophicum]|jgi:PAS domain S-box-containing protein
MQENSLNQQIYAVRECISGFTPGTSAGPDNNSLRDLLSEIENLTAAATRAEKERQQFRDLIWSSTDGFVVTDTDGRVIDANPAAVALLGEPLPGTLFAACGDPDAQSEIIYMLADLNTRTACPPREITLCSRSGTPVRVVISAAGCGAGEKRWLIRELPPEHWTDQKKAGEIYHLLFDRMLEGIYIFEIIRDGDGCPVDYRYVDVNPEGLKLIGRGREEVIGRSVSAVFPNMDDPLRDLFYRVAETGESAHIIQPAPTLGRYLDVTLYRPQRDLLALLVYDITDRKQMEETLQASEEKYRKLFENTSDSIEIFEMVRDEHGEIVDWILRDANPVSQRDLGRLDEIVGKRVTDLFGAGPMAKYLARSREIMASGVGQKYEHSFWDNRRYYISSTFPIEEDLLVTASAEITRRKRMEEELRLQQQRLELALASARMIAWDWDCATDQFEISGDFAEIYGRPPFARPEEFLLLIHPDDMGRLRPEGKQSGPYHTEYRIIRPDTGAVVWLESRGEVQRDGAGQVIRAVGVTMDITDQKESRQALEHQQELLQGVINAIPVMITIYDPDLRYFRLNREIQRVLGWSEEDGARGDLMARFFPDPEYRKMAGDYMQSLKPGWRNLLLAAKDGSVVETAWANIRLSDDTRVGIGIDIRERKRAEAALLESEGRFRALLNASPNVVMLIDRDGTILALNEVVAERIGGSVQELMGAPVYDYLPPEVAARRREIIAEVFATGRPVRFVDEREGIVLYNSLSPVADAEGNVVRVAVISSDITEQRRSEEMRHQAFTQIEQNMEQFAILGDHIRLPLQVILATSELLDDEQAAERIHKQVWRINDIVRQLDRGWVESREIREFLRRHELV